jgi:hypothetical protein
MNQIDDFRAALGLAPLEPGADVRERAAQRLDHAIARASRPSPVRRRLLIALAVAGVLVTVGWTAVRPLAIHLFAAHEGPEPSATVQAAFAAMAELPHGAVDLTTIDAVAALDTADGRITVYAARLARQDGLATVYDIDGRFYGGCLNSPPPNWSLLHNGGCRAGHWSFSEGSGVVDARVASLRLSLADGTTRPVPLHDGVFVYLVGRDECGRGRRPVELLARNAAGALLVRRPAWTSC